MGKEYWRLAFRLELSDDGSTYKKGYECYKAWLQISDLWV